ncbi:MAG: hypothetical protein M3P14_01270 [Chloroflexota bacterium]|nr:hypothetical protein [Chloroflexota bacterium]
MTMVVSVIGMIGRFTGDLLTSALAWASSLLFGRVPRTRQIYLIVMMAAAFLWIVFVLSLVVPSIASFLLAETPHPPFVNHVWLASALLLGVILLPLCVGLAGYLVPAEGERPSGLAIVLELLRGYLLAPLISGALIFLAGVGTARKIRSLRHGWSDTHVPIVVKPDGYDQLVADLQDVLASADLPMAAKDAPWVLTVPALLLSSVAGDNVRKLRPDRLIELTGPSMKIGVYPSDIAISGEAKDRTRARAAMVSRLATTSAHLTTSAEAQEVEDRLGELARSEGDPGGIIGTAARGEFEAIDRQLLELAVSTDEWDILYRMRLQIERDLLARSASWTALPDLEHSEARTIAAARAST